VTDETELYIQRKRAALDFGLFAIAEQKAKLEPATTHPRTREGRTQNTAILTHLRAGHGLTSLEALQMFGCSRLAARIADLKGAGYAITSTMVTLPNGKRVASYRLEG
jgi:hypothetical protein